MSNRAPTSTARGLGRLLYDVSPAALEQCRRNQERMASWGNPKRCETGECNSTGGCLSCGAINGEECRYPGAACPERWPGAIPK